MGYEAQNEVERALLAASQDEGRFGEFLVALAGAELYVPHPGGSGEEGEPVEGEELVLPLVEHEGRTYVPVFTSMAQFRLGAPHDMPHVRLRTEGLVAEWPEEHGMAVNPGGEIGVALEAADVRALARPEAVVSAQRFGAGTRLLLGEPAEEPGALLDAVSQACDELGTVVAAYRALMAVEGEEDTPQIVIGLELDRGVDPDAAFGVVGGRVAAAATGPFAFVVVDETDLSPVARFMLLETDPFFRRS